MKRKICYTLILIFISSVFSYSDSFLQGGIMKNPIDNYPSLMYEANDALELSIDPLKYKAGSGDQFLFSMILLTKVLVTYHSFFCNHFTFCP